MRRFMILGCVAFVTLLSGCKTLEVALTHPTTGVHIVARMESQEPVISQPLPLIQRLPALEQFATVR